MKKRFTLTIFLLIILIATNVFAATNVSMEIVEDNICTVNLNEKAYFESKIIKSDLPNHQVTVQLKVTNDSKAIIPTGEIMLVIDSSSSMNATVSENTTRKDVVLNSANDLVTSLLKANSTSLKIGVVTFSTGSETDENGYLITGTSADAQKVCDLSNDLTTLTNSISAIEGTGPYTNLDAGIQLAKTCFSAEETNKYMIILTDGLPNLAIGHNDLVSYAGLTDIINQTKSTLSSLNGINVITMLTGIDNEEANFRVEGENAYTYGEVINDVFGTEETPTIGKFYNITDDEIETTITNTIYNDLLPISQSLKDITIINYFTQVIVDNFDMTYVEGTDISHASQEIDKETNSITWTIPELASGETKILEYNLTLKDNFNEAIIGEILSINQKVDINFKDFDDVAQTKTSDVTPKLKLTAIPQPPVDDTVTPEPLPAAGSPIIPISFVLLIGISIFFGYKSRKIK